MKKQRTPQQLRKVLDRCGIEFADCVRAFGESATDNPYVNEAHTQAREGELQVDSVTVVSDGDDSGAYVMAWVWIDRDAAGLAIGDVLERTVTRLSSQPMDTPERAAKLSWLSETIENFGDELDDLQQGHRVYVGHLQSGEATAPLSWNHEGVCYRFLPSAALTELIAIARERGLDAASAAEVERFVDERGDALDGALVAIDITALGTAVA